MAYNVGAFYHYIGFKEDPFDSKEYHRLDFDDVLFSVVPELEYSDLIKRLYSQINEENHMSTNGTDKKFNVRKVYLSFGFKGEGWKVIELFITDENYLEYETIIKKLCTIIDSLDLELTSMIWADEVKNETVTRGNLSSWKNEVLKEGKCACCGGDKHLEAHHIFNYSEYEELRDDPNNGIVLCRWCHKKLHSYYGAKSTPIDLCNFLKQFAIGGQK